MSSEEDAKSEEKTQFAMHNSREYQPLSRQVTMQNNHEVDKKMSAF